MIFWYHSLSCVCDYCLALDGTLVSQTNPEIGYLMERRAGR
jgi:hypothetical protein